MVISWKSSDIYVLNSEFDDNYYDGVAYYDSSRIYTTNVSMKNNSSAGISLDNDLSDSIFSNCIVDSNGDVGIFIRFSRELKFNNCTVKNSRNWAVFWGHDDENNGVFDVMFSNVQFLNNNGGLFMSSTASAQSANNSVVSCVFRANEKNDRQNIQSSGSKVWATANLEIE